MKAKFIFIVLALLSAVGTAKAYIPTIEADTIFKGFNSGPVSGIVFANEGRSVIVMHYNQPVEIDLETHQIVKEFEAVPNAKSSGTEMKFIKNFNYLIIEISSSLIDGKKDFVGSVIWDYNTGKIIKTMENNYFISNDEHTYMWAKSNGYIYEYDFAYFLTRDQLLLGVHNLAAGATWLCNVIVPDSRKILFSVHAFRPDDYGGTISLGSLLELVDFGLKKVVNIPFTKETTITESSVEKILVNEIGKYYAILIGDKCFFYDANLSFLYYLSIADLQSMLGFDKIDDLSAITTYLDNYLILNINIQNQYLTACYNIEEKKVYKYLGFNGIGTYCKETQKLALVNSKGVVAIFDDEITSVKESDKSSNPDITYSNNQLEVNSDNCFIGEAQIYDMEGKLVSVIGTKQFIIGKNIIQVEQILPSGIYILSITTDKEQISKKFIVDR